MVTKSTIGGGMRRSLRIVAVPTVMLSLTLLLSLTLTACGDKEAPIDPSHLAEIRQAKEAAEHEKSQRVLSEDRFGKLLIASALGIGVALVLGVAIGSSSRRRPEDAAAEGADLEGAKTDV